MPHTTSNEVVAPSLGALSTVDVWEDPRSLTTFSTFHHLNGKNNSTFSETSFHSSPKESVSTDNRQNRFVEEQKTNGINHFNCKAENGNGSVNGQSDSFSKNNLAIPFSKQKTSPKFGKSVKPVTPPPILNQKLRIERLNGNCSFDDTQKDQNNVTTSCNNSNNGVDKTGGRQSSPLANFLQTTLDGANGEELNQTKENGGSEPERSTDEVTINLGATDKRFGFSVVGGCDEGFVPRIENITPESTSAEYRRGFVMVDLGGYVIILVETTDKKIKLYGSPADRADLEVGDEILEVNGRSLDNCTHTEVISHIHQCIRSRTICLRVKRKMSHKLALDLGQTSNVQDAFVIAVEQQARERLEKLSALKKIKPVDMTKLSQELNECTNSTRELNGVIENNPIYVTTVPEIHNATLERVKKDHLDNYVNSTSTPHGDKSIHEQTMQGLNGHSQVGIVDHDTHDQELELTQEIIDKESYDDALSPSSPETPPRERLLVESQNGADCVTNRFSELCVSVETLLPNLPDKLKSSPNDIHQQRQQLPSIKQSVVSDQNLSKVNCSVLSKSHPYKPNTVDSELRTHREMAVDVPDSFVGVAKTSPRYPPQKVNDRGSFKREGHPEFFINSSGDSSSNENDPSSKMNSVTRKSVSSFKSNLDNNAIPKVTVDSSDYDNKNLEDASEEQLERIRKYQEDIRRRKIAEEKQAKENEFLRNSLRGSKKLQALEANPPQSVKRGVENTAFELEEESSSQLEGTKKTPELAKTFGASELLQSLYRLSSSLQGNGHKDSDLMLVESLIQNADFQNILAIHNKVQEVCCFKCPPTPVSTEAQDITQEVINTLQESSSPEAAELVDILSKFEVEGLIYAHDKVAERQAVPTITPDEELLDRASQYTEESVKIVRIDKTNEPLGATVRNEGEAVVIGRIVKGGAAEKSGLLHEGDEILEVNGVEMRGKSVNDVCDILATMNGTLTFLIIPTQQEAKKNSQMEAVMHDDPNWWQAYREGEEDQALAGLVPSKNFQQQRESMKQTIIGEASSKEKTKKAGKFLCAKKYHKKKKKKLYNANEDLEGDQILTYEEVALYYPRANRKRPTVLIGPPNIGRHELRQRLMEDTERFAAAVPHTSRAKRDSESDGVDYHFISRSQFEADITAGKFVEHGEYEKNYYGTSLDAIRAVVNSGKICVLNLHPQSLKILKNSDLKPYVVFVAPPSLEKLRQNRLKAGDNPKDEELKDIIEKAREMEDNYGHYFDMVIINSDIDKAFNELLKEINTLEREPQWVPKIWLGNYTN
ncbi:MAGUK p55 subfamily member 5 like protein [Argiope bruennichi]|uniref:MAGUK p55 subfamily member 5 like protein n=1 Tax=Argiope bruennichi TaxID=94029 RepID=A0A8T0G3I4_ARGBR|nr:MAGUK p55 subfamily member 5 like protein [Argiope bruennichi]